MSDQPWWKRPVKKPASEVVEERVKELGDRGRAAHTANRGLRRGGGTPRSVIFTQKMAIPKKKRKR